MGSSRRQDLEDRLIEFAVSVCTIARQAANYAEAQGAESKRDFAHKMRTCLKELRETLVWLTLVGRMKLCATSSPDLVTAEANELISILVASIKRATNRR
jgi:four helix bundle protein